MSKNQKQASAYLDLETYASFAALSRRHQRSLSGHLKHIIQREIARDDISKDLLTTQTDILIGVNALLKHHDNKDLFQVVQLTRAGVTGGASNER